MKNVGELSIEEVTVGMEIYYFSKALNKNSGIKITNITEKSFCYVGISQNGNNVKSYGSTYRFSIKKMIDFLNGELPRY